MAAICLANICIPERVNTNKIEQIKAVVDFDGIAGEEYSVSDK